MDEATTVTVLDNIRKSQLECPICYSQYINPKTLTCAHNFCQRCLEGMMEAHPTKNIICPICRKETTLPETGIGNLPNSFVLINLMETITEQEQLVQLLQTKISCDDCDEEDEAVIYCCKCKEFLCEICDNAHKRSKKTKGHEKDSIKHLISGKAIFKSNLQLLKKVKKCERHTNRDKIFYCTHCFLKVCSSCTRDHQPHHHEVFDLLKAIENIKIGIANLVKQGENRLKLFSDKRQLLERLYNDHKEKIKQKHKIITDDAYGKEKQKLKDKVTQFCCNRGKQFEEIMAVNSRTEEKIKQQLEKAHNKRKEVLDIDLLEMHKSLVQGFQDALAVGEPTGCVCLNFQDFKGSLVFTDEEIYLMFGKKRGMTDSEIEHMMTVGTRVVRGKNWYSGDQDGDPPGEGTIWRSSGTWEVNVHWDEMPNGYTHRYQPRCLDLA